MTWSQHVNTPDTLALRSPRIPVRAALVQEIRGTVRQNGRAAIIRYWQSQDSDGYKTRYKARPAAYLEIRVDGQETFTRRYSGARYPLAEREYRACADEMDAAV